MMLRKARAEEGTAVDSRARRATRVLAVPQSSGSFNPRPRAIELAPNRIISVTTYNGQFPGPLLRLKEGERVTVDIRNETDTPEQLHWHGQFIAPDVDGAAEEGTPSIPPHGSRRISFVPKPSGFRFYHTHVRAGANLAAGPVQRPRRTGLH
jgi:FtsP/CotA-like multicopper oxidase with cupredoxin domain